MGFSTLVGIWAISYPIFGLIHTAGAGLLCDERPIIDSGLTEFSRMSSFTARFEKGFGWILQIILVRVNQEVVTRLWHHDVQNYN